MSEESTPKLTLITFDGCPNADKARELLRALRTEFEDVDQGSLPNGHALRNYSSPTLLAGERVVFGSRTGSGAGGCSLALPSATELSALLHRTKGSGS